MNGFEKAFEGGEVVFKEKKKDPSLRSQLFARSDLPLADRAQAYIDATLKAPSTSAATRRSWKRALGIGRVIL